MAGVDKRPEWNHEVSIGDAQFLRCPIVMVKYISRQVGEDSSEEWLELTNAAGKTKRVSNPGPNKPTILQYLKVCDFFWPGGVYCVKSYYREKWTKTLLEMEEFDRNHADELAEYRRLQEKFGGIK